MNEFLSRLCAFLQEFPEQQVSFPIGEGELFVMYRGIPPEEEDKPKEIEESEGLRLPTCHHRPPTDVQSGGWFTARELGAKYGLTPQKVGRLGTQGKIQRRKDALSRDYKFLDPGTNPAV